MQWWEEIDFKEARRRGEPPVREYPRYSVEIDDVLRDGLWMAPYGSHTWAHNRDAALAALARLSSIGVQLDGTDVWTRSRDGWRFNGENICVDPLPGEPPAAFLARTGREVAAYISAYPAPDDDVLFELVLR